MRVFSIIQKLRRKSRSFQAFVSNSICSLHLNTLAKSSMPFFSPSLFLPLSHVRPHTLTHAHTARCRKLLANANSHTGIALFRLRVGGPRDEGRGGAQDSWFAFAYSSAVLPSTFPATHPPWNSAGTRWCGCMHSLRMERGALGTRGGGTAGEDSSRVFLVSIHNCKFPSAYLCSFRPTFLVYLDLQLITRLARISAKVNVDDRNARREKWDTARVDSKWMLKVGRCRLRERLAAVWELRKWVVDILSKK